MARAFSRRRLHPSRQARIDALRAVFGISLALLAISIVPVLLDQMQAVALAQALMEAGML